MTDTRAELLAALREIADVAFEAFCDNADETDTLSWINNHCRALLDRAALAKDDPASESPEKEE